MNRNHVSNGTQRFGALLYAIGLSVGALVLAIGAYLVAALNDYHAAMGYGILLVFSIPLIAIVGLLGVLTYRWYRPLRGTWRGRWFYFVQMLIAVVVGVAGSFVLAWIVR